MSHNVRLLLVASTLIHSGTALLAPVYAIFIAEIDGTLLQTGVAVGVYTILRGVFYLRVARIEEARFSRKRMMASGYLLMGVTFFFYTGVSNIWQVFVLQAILSLGEALITPSWSATIATSLTEGKERDIYSRFYGYRSLFEGTAAILGGAFAMYFGFKGIFVLMGIFAVTSAGLVQLLREDQEEM